MVSGLCECGCGGATERVAKNDAQRGTRIGQPRRFIRGHNWRRESTASPYKQRYAPWVKKGKNGQIKDHVLIAMSAIGGRELPNGSEVHHVDGDTRNNVRRNLVICQSKSYHALLHVRTRTLKSGGDPNTEKVCSGCQKPRPFDQFYRSKHHMSSGRGPRCISCAKSEARQWYARQKLSTA